MSTEAIELGTEAPTEIDIGHEQGRTELANSRRFVTRFAEEVRWCATWQKWLFWTGKRWKVDAGEEVERLAKQTADEVWSVTFDEFRRGTCDAKMVAALYRFARDTSAARGIHSFLRLARSDERLQVKPEQLDADPLVLNVANGTLDLRTGERRQHDRRDLLTKLCPTPFVAEAERPLWESFLFDVLAGDDELITYLHRLAGYWITGLTSLHILAILYGNGGNGKSVFLNTLLSVLGQDYSMKASADLLLVKGDTHPTALTDLFGKRLVVCMETDDGRRMAESLVKELTGGDAIRARRMREDNWQFDPQHKIALGTNHKPTIRGTDNGIWRRLRLLPFTVSIPQERQDIQLPEKLKGEASGILNWLIAGCVAWQRDGMQEPDAVKLATKKYREDSDSIGRFIDDCCYTGDGLEAGATALYLAYKAWCDGEPCNQKLFGEYLSTKGIETKKNGAGRKVRLGIGLRVINGQTDSPDSSSG